MLIRADRSGFGTAGPEEYESISVMNSEGIGKP